MNWLQCPPKSQCNTALSPLLWSLGRTVSGPGVESVNGECSRGGEIHLDAVFARQARFSQHDGLVKQTRCVDREETSSKEVGRRREREVEREIMCVCVSERVRVCVCVCV